LLYWEKGKNKVGSKRSKKNKSELLQFINFAWRVYEHDPYWVPPIKTDLLKFFLGNGSDSKVNCGPHTFFMAWDNNIPVGRILVGINKKKNHNNNNNVGYFGYLEMINSSDVLKMLMDESFHWLKKHNINRLVGPLCPDDDIEGRGILIEGFDSSPVLMNSYNPPYYQILLEKNGFIKDKDFFAYYSDQITGFKERLEKVSEFAMQKFNFKIDKVDIKFLDREAKDIVEIINKIIQSGNEVDKGFEYSNPPTYETFLLEVKKFLPFLDRDLIYIARSGDVPIGFVLAIPDYNEVLKKLNGQLFPFGIFKYLWFKRKIKGIRGFAQFVIPEFQNKAVVAAIFRELVEAAERKQYNFIESSTICENNLPSRRIFENIGLSPYKVYRVYRKDNNTVY